MPFIHHIHHKGGTEHAELPESDRQQTEYFIARWRGLKDSDQTVTFGGPNRTFTLRYGDINETWIEDI